jgi:hypothetical protein
MFDKRFGSITDSRMIAGRSQGWRPKAASSSGPRRFSDANERFRDVSVAEIDDERG